MLEFDRRDVRDPSVPIARAVSVPWGLSCVDPIAMQTADLQSESLRSVSGGHDPFVYTCSEITISIMQASTSTVTYLASRAPLCLRLAKLSDGLADAA